MRENIHESLHSKSEYDPILFGFIMNFFHELICHRPSRDRLAPSIKFKILLTDRWRHQETWNLAGNWGPPRATSMPKFIQFDTCVLELYIFFPEYDPNWALTYFSAPRWHFGRSMSMVQMFRVTRAIMLPNFSSLHSSVSELQGFFDLAKMAPRFAHLTSAAPVPACLASAHSPCHSHQLSIYKLFEINYCEYFSPSRLSQFTTYTSIA